MLLQATPAKSLAVFMCLYREVVGGGGDTGVTDRGYGTVSGNNFSKNIQPFFSVGGQ
jgi:hypothetical protein